MRRLPVYLLLDCSESMAGEPFDAMNNGLKKMIDELRSDPMALETAAISIITFASRAKQAVPLTDLIRFQQPLLQMGSGTALGDALQKLENYINSEVRKTSAEQKGDFKPIVFILTDGEPTDSWEGIADQFKQKIVGRVANVIAVGCGPDANLEKLRRITETVITLAEADGASFSRFFQWVSASVTSASVAFEKGAGKEAIMPGLPEECMAMAKPGGPRQPPQPDRYFFMHVKCLRSGDFYLIRYAKTEGKSGILSHRQSTYRAIAAHPIDYFDFESEQAQGGQALRADSLLGVLPCPYCQNPILAMCECGRMFCSPVIVGHPMQLKCPWCSSIGVYAPGASGSIGGGRG